jgi:hypothetical protein
VCVRLEECPCGFRRVGLGKIMGSESVLLYRPTREEVSSLH